MTDIHWKPMTGGRRIPSILPCITVEQVWSEQMLQYFYRYRKLDKNAFIIRRWTSDYEPSSPTMEGLPVLWVKEPWSE